MRISSSVETRTLTRADNIAQPGRENRGEQSQQSAARKIELFISFSYKAPVWEAHRLAGTWDCCAGLICLIVFL